MKYNAFLSGVIFLLSAFHHVASRGLSSESEAVPSSAGYYSAEMGGVDDPVIEVLRRSTGGEEGIRDALRYLDALDKFYGEAGRPSEEYLVEKRTANKFMDDVELKMAQMSRPRFGKRSMSRSFDGTRHLYQKGL